MRSFRVVLLLLSSLVLITSCGSDKGFTVQPIPSAFVTIVNAIPDSPLLSISSNNVNLGTVQFGRTSATGRLLPQIQLPILVQYSNNGTVATLLEESIFVDVNHNRVIILTGTLAAPKVISIDRAPTTFATGNTDTEVTVVNATSNLDSATIDITNPNGADHSITVAKDKFSSTVTTTGGDAVLATIKNAIGNVIWESGEFNLTASQSRLLVLVDYFGPTNPIATEQVRMFSTTEQSGAGLFPNEKLPVELRFANMASKLGPLDLNDGTNVLVSAQAFPTVSNNITLTSGTKAFSVKLNSDTSQEITAADLALLPGNFYTLGVSALDTTTGLSLLLQDKRLSPARARINVMNLSPTAGGVDVHLTDPNAALSGSSRLVLNLVHLAVSASEVQSKTFELSLATANSTTSVFGPQTVSFDTNKIYTILIHDNDGGGAPVKILGLDDFVN